MWQSSGNGQSLKYLLCKILTYMLSVKSLLTLWSTSKHDYIFKKNKKWHDKWTYIGLRAALQHCIAEMRCWELRIHKYRRAEVMNAWIWLCSSQTLMRTIQNVIIIIFFLLFKNGLIKMQGKENKWNLFSCLASTSSTYLHPCYFRVHGRQLTTTSWVSSSRQNCNEIKNLQVIHHNTALSRTTKKAAKPFTHIFVTMKLMYHYAVTLCKGSSLCCIHFCVN